LRPALHFLGDFYEIPSIYFIARRPRRRLFQIDFFKGMELSFVFHRACDEARFESRIAALSIDCARKIARDRIAYLGSRRDQTR
jgi:hypothetical protein